jgi:hypothetical protein
VDVHDVAALLALAHTFICFVWVPEVANHLALGLYGPALPAIRDVYQPNFVGRVIAILEPLRSLDDNRFLAIPHSNLIKM